MKRESYNFPQLLLMRAWIQRACVETSFTGLWYRLKVLTKASWKIAMCSENSIASSPKSPSLFETDHVHSIFKPYSTIVFF